MTRLLSEKKLFVLFIITSIPTVLFAVDRSTGGDAHEPLTPPSDLVAPSFDFQNRPAYKPCGNEIAFSQ